MLLRLPVRFERIGEFGRALLHPEFQCFIGLAEGLFRVATASVFSREQDENPAQHERTGKKTGERDLLGPPKMAFRPAPALLQQSSFVGVHFRNQAADIFHEFLAFFGETQLRHSVRFRLQLQGDAFRVNCEPLLNQRLQGVAGLLRRLCDLLDDEVHVVLIDPGVEARDARLRGTAVDTDGVRRALVVVGADERLELRVPGQHARAVAHLVRVVLVNALRDHRRHDGRV